MAPARSYVERALGEHLAAVRKAMEDLTKPMDSDDLNRIGFHLYLQFRPEEDPEEKGWGAKGVLDPERIRRAAG